MLTLIRGSQTKTDVLESFVAVESCVEVPSLVPLLDDAVVIVELKVVARLYFGEQRASAGEGEPEFEFIGD